MYSFASSTRIPELYIWIFAACKNQTLKRVPITTLDIRSMITEAKFFFAGSKVKYSCGAIVSTRKKLKTRVRERKIANASIVVGLEVVFLRKFNVRIYNEAFLVAWNNKFFVVCEADGLNRLFMDGTLTCEHKFGLGVPLEDLACWGTGNEIFAVFDPLYSEKRLSLSMLAFRNELGCCCFPVITRVCEVVG